MTYVLSVWYFCGVCGYGVCLLRVICVCGVLCVFYVWCVYGVVCVTCTVYLACMCVAFGVWCLMCYMCCGMVHVGCECVCVDSGRVYRGVYFHLALCLVLGKRNENSFACLFVLFFINLHLRMFFY